MQKNKTNNTEGINFISMNRVDISLLGCGNMHACMAPAGYANNLSHLHFQLDKDIHRSNFDTTTKHKIRPWYI